MNVGRVVNFVQKISIFFYIFVFLRCGHTIAQSQIIFQTTRLRRTLYALYNKLNFKYNGLSLQRDKSKKSDLNPILTY